MKATITMQKSCRFAVALVFAFGLSGCATTGNGTVKNLSAERTSQILVVGKTTRPDVNAAFGAATVTHFDNGYELWVYQVGWPKIVDSLPWINLVASSANNERELSVLFDKTGVVKKYLLRDK